MPELVFFRRGEEVLRVALERQRVVVGRSEECDIVIPDPHVSRQHLALSMGLPPFAWVVRKFTVSRLSRAPARMRGRLPLAPRLLAGKAPFLSASCLVVLASAPCAYAR